VSTSHVMEKDFKMPIHTVIVPKKAILYGSAVFILFLFVFYCFGCTKTEVGSEDDARRTLTILNWEDYIDMNVVHAFEESHNVDVKF